MKLHQLFDEIGQLFCLCLFLFEKNNTLVDLLVRCMVKRVKYLICDFFEIRNNRI